MIPHFRGVGVADIFVSYTSSDREWAFWIGQELEKLGHTPHIHEWEISAGGNIFAWMRERHDRADHILCVVSSTYLTKEYSGLESDAAVWAAVKKRHNFMLPAFIEDCEAPTLLDVIKRCDLYGLAEEDAQGRSVLSSLMGRRGFPPAKMSESIGDNPNRRLSHAGIAAGGFAHHPRPSSRRRQAVRSGHGVAVRRSQHGRRGQLLPANA